MDLIPYNGVACGGSVSGRWLDFCFSLNEEGLSSEQRLGPVYGAIVKKLSCRRLCIRRHYLGRVGNSVFAVRVGHQLGRVGDGKFYRALVGSSSFYQGRVGDSVFAVRVGHYSVRGGKIR